MVAAVTGLALASGGVLAAAVGTATAASTAARVGTGPSASVQTGPPGGPVPRGFRVASVTFVSADDGWVLGRVTKGCTHAPCTAVLRTTNSSESWASIPAPRYKVATGTSAGLRRIRFADDLDGYAYGSELWTTHTGGSSWQRIKQVPGSITDLETSAGIVYAATTVTSSGKQEIYASAVHNDNWQRVTALPEATGIGGLGDITLNGSAGWIILNNRLWATQNDATWTKESFRCGSGYGIGSVAAFSPTKITLLCVGNPGLGSTTKVVYASSNGGASFTKVGTAPRGGDGGLLAEATPRHLFIATASGASWIYASTNGGRTWHTSKRIDDGGLGWNDFGFTTRTQGVAVEGTQANGSSRLWLTRTAGRSWGDERNI
jgi:hypothetical protein